MAESTGSFSWQTVKALFTKRVYLTPVPCGNQLYVIGGCDAAGTPVDAVEVI